MKFTKDFVVASLQEAADIAASTISQQFALNQIATKGSCTLEEAENMYNLAHRVLAEGSEDLIPETLDLPEDGAGATDEVDPTLAQDQAVDADVGADEGADLDLEDLDGIILPDSEGNQYIIQGGILTPYNEEDTSADGDEDGDAGIPVDGDNAGAPVDGDDNLEEGTVVTTTPEAGAIEEGTAIGCDPAAMANAEAGDVKVDTIQENTVFAGNSSIVANLLKNMNV